VTLSADGADVYTRVQTALIEARAGSTICFPHELRNQGL
jgi:hypothetical protein